MMRFRIKYVQYRSQYDSYETPMARALRGAAWMDRHFPGWDEKVNIRTLDVYCPQNCILGQCDPGGWSGAMLGWEARDIVSHGFAGTRESGITEAWRQLILARRNTKLPEIKTPEPAQERELIAV